MPNPAIDSSVLGGPLDAVTVQTSIGLIERQRLSIAALDATSKIPTEVGDATNNAVRVNIVAGGTGGGSVTEGTVPWLVAVRDTSASNVTVEPGDSGNRAVRVNIVAGGTGGGAVTIADGADVALGSTTDIAVGDATGTVNAHIRQLTKQLAGGISVSVSNFPGTQPISGSVDVTDRAARLVGHVNVDNFPASQPVTIAAAIDVSDRSARLLGHTTVDNFPATQPVSIAAAVDVSDRTARLLGHTTVDNFPASQPVSGTVSATQGTNPWITDPIDRIARQIGTLPFSTRSDTFTTTGSGVLVTVTTTPLKAFSIQVKGTGTPATTWDIRLEGSLDGLNFSQILQHTNVTGDGAVVWSGTLFAPSLYFRSRVAGLSLGTATNVVVTILGVA